MPSYADSRGRTYTLPPEGYEGGLRGWERLADRLKVDRGVVAVVPDAEPERVGLILLPETAQGDRKPDIGTVVASGVPEYWPGDRVLYAPWGGSWFRPFVVGKLRVHDLRFFGPLAAGDPTKVVREEIETVLPCEVVGRELRPIRDMVCIRRDDVVTETKGGMTFILPDEVTHRTLKATVVSAGPRAELGGVPLKAGDRVVYNPSGLVLDLTSLGPIEGWFGNPGAYALIRAGNLLALIEEE